jgi:hypothetical protein
MSKSLSKWQEEIHTLAKVKGWYEEERNIGEVIALIHSELSEALEEWREGTPAYYIKDGKPCGFWVEMADAVIRILDYAEAQDISLESVIEAKHNYNKTRPYRHGGKKA